MQTTRVFVAIVVALLASSCAAGSGQMSEAESREIVDSVTSGMTSYAAALGSLERERIMAHYLESTDFRLTSDGTVNTREAMRGVIDGLADTLNRMDVTWQSITVTPLSVDAAVAVAPFRTTSVAKDNTVSRVRGVATWVWVRRSGEWRMLFGHGDHYPDTDGIK